MNNNEYTDVFISRKSEDATYAKKIYDYLTKEGLSVFESDHSLKEMGNADYVSAIDNALENTSHLMVIASSKEHINSSWVEAEWKFFLNRKRSGKTDGNLFTVICSDMTLDEVPASLQNYEIIYYNRKNFSTIYNYCRHKSKPAKPQPVKPYLFNDGNWFKKATIALFILLVSLVAITVYFSTRPFDATIFLKPKPSLKLSNAYPPFEDGMLSLFINGNEMTKEVLSNGEVNFRQLDFSVKNEWIQAKYEGKYWKLEKDSIQISTEANINVIPNGSLATIFGQTMNENGEIIPDVKVQIDTDTIVFSNSDGIVRVKLPMKMQKRKYLLVSSKSGYINNRESYSPLSGRIDVILSKSNK